MNLCYLALSEFQCTLQLAGCNFSCKGCFSPARVGVGRDVSVENIVERIPGDRRVVVAGGEPTLQARELRGLLLLLGGRRVLLSTNGYFLSDRVVEGLSGAEVHIDLKAYTDSVHLAYTGWSNLPVLEAIERLYRHSVDFEVETVLIPRVVDFLEVERIAEFLSSISRDISLRIIRYVPVNGFSRRPTGRELAMAVALAQKHLAHVTTSVEVRSHPVNSVKIFFG
ncbi:radical SAM protein [Methanosarcinales archaeon ex4572_44]|nr:MAG: radical SAM protein [Methanosarcinales archaeon ex4484_138]PHP46126.1 MAG: radical SAM protein [Methanosarcinales archaeon ex4572_44]RLG26416.1 MAG: radical SAM protein [Methanosarcinales archaeon]RLG26858.1 MAG: radical SAM protein [Methanosarcinales archaeon]